MTFSPDTAATGATAGPAWQPMSTAPHDGTHIIAVMIEPGDDDVGTRDVEMVVEAWWQPTKGWFGEGLPWRSGGYGHNGVIGDRSSGEGLVLCWMPIPTAGRLSRSEAQDAHCAALAAAQDPADSKGGDRG